MVVEQTIVSWDKIDSLIEDIHTQTLEDSSNCAIIGIARGGLVPGVLLSQYKKDSLVFSVGMKSYSGTTRGKELIYQLPDIDKLNEFDLTYIIDDICDSGLTFKNLKKQFSSVNIKTISLYYRTNSIYKPDIIGQELTDSSWIVFPWEKD